MDRIDRYKEILSKKKNFREDMIIIFLFLFLFSENFDNNIIMQ